MPNDKKLRPKRPPLAELPPEDLRPEDVPVADPETELDANLMPVPKPPPAWEDDSRELVYEPQSPEAQFQNALELFNAGRAYLMACPTNVDRTSLQGRALLLNAAQPGTLEIEAGRPLAIRCRWWAILPDLAPGENGAPPRPLVRTCLITPEGAVYRTTSEYAPRRAANMGSAFTPEEWERGIPLVITARPSKRHPGGSWHEITVDLEALARDHRS